MQVVPRNEEIGSVGARYGISQTSPIPSTSVVSFEPMLSAADAGHLLNIHPVTLLRWAREGRIPHCRLGRRVVFRASQLDRWVSSPLICGVRNAA
jgi:excisionase family DNA binding protein